MLFSSDKNKKCRRHDANCGREPDKKNKKLGETPFEVEWPGQKRFVVPAFAIRQHWPGLAKEMIEYGSEAAGVALRGEKDLGVAYQALSWIFNRIDYHSRQQCRFKPIDSHSNNKVPENPFDQLLTEIMTIPTDTMNRILDEQRLDDPIENAMKVLKSIGRILQFQIHRDSMLAFDLRYMAERLMPFTGRTGLYLLSHAVWCVYGQSSPGFKNFLQRIPRDLRQDVLERAKEQKDLGKQCGKAVYQVLKTLPGATGTTIRYIT